MLDFEIHTHFVFHIGSFEVWVTDTLIFTVAIMLLLIIFALIVRIKLRNFQEVPTGFQIL